MKKEAKDQKEPTPKLVASSIMSGNEIQKPNFSFDLGHEKSASPLSSSDHEMEAL